jgi:hypothetical protein
VAIIGSILTLLGLSLGLLGLFIAPMPPNDPMPAAVHALAFVLLFLVHGVHDPWKS